MIVVNNAYQLAPWADCLYACDWKWWQVYQPRFDGLKVTQDARVQRPDVYRVPSVNQPGLSLDPMRIHQGGNGGYQALNLAVLFGAKTILLLGYDMHDQGGTHFHGRHSQALTNPHASLFAQWRKNFDTTIPDLKRAGCEVLNVTPQSALTCFPMATLEEVLCV